MMVGSVKPQGYPGGDALVYSIELLDGSVFFIKTSYLSLNGQGEIFSFINKELSDEEEGAFRFASACFQAEKAALHLIKRAEQTSVGLSRKLEHRGHSPSSVKAVISHLTELEILSDIRYARLWLQSRLVRSGESPRHLIMGLCNRGIDKNIAASTLKSVLDFGGESLLLKKYLQRNRPKTAYSLNNPAIFDKSTCYAGLLKSKLKYEGFSSAVIQSVWEEQGLET